MNRMKNFFILTIAMLLTSTFGAVAQVAVQFQIPIHFEGVDPAVDTSTVWIGISGDGPNPPGVILDNTYGPDLDPAYGPVGMWGEQLAPPHPPTYKIWTTVMDIPSRSGVIGATGMFYYDFRGFESMSQVDTFAIQIKGSDIGNGPMTISWPANISNYANAWELRKKQGPKWNIVMADMTAGTSYMDPNAAYATLLDYLIIKTGVRIILIPPPIFISPTSLDFGIVEVGSSASLTLTATNDYLTDSLNISSVVASADYSVSPTSAVIPPQGSQIFTVTFIPSTEGTIPGSIVFTYDDRPGSPSTILVTGKGQIPVLPPGAYVQFQVPIYFEGVNPAVDTSTVWIGVSGDGPGGVILDNTYLWDLDPAYGPVGMWREVLGPMCLSAGSTPFWQEWLPDISLCPPGGPPPIWWVWFPDIPGRYERGQNKMIIYDFRGYDSPFQIDTFAIRILGTDVANGPLTLTWPANLTDYSNGPWILKKKQGANWVTLIDMLTATSYTDPNTAYALQLDYLIIKEGVKPPPFVLFPSSLDFGIVRFDSTASLTVTGTNQSTTFPINISSVVASTDYSVSPTSAVIPALGSKLFTITFTPSTADTIPGTVVFILNELNSPITLPLTGIGRPAGPIFILNLTAMSFDTVVVGGNSTQSVTVTNTDATDTLIISGTTSITAYDIAPNPTAAYPIRVTPGASQSFDITFTPPSAGTFAGDIIFTHNATGSPSILSVTGSGQPSGPIFTLNPTAISFDTIVVGGNSTQSVTVTNTDATDTLIISGTTSITAYDIAPNPPAAYPIRVTPGASQSFDITFTPPSAGTFAGDIIFTHNAPGSPSILSVTGVGRSAGPIFSANPTEVNFGTVEVGVTSSRNLTINNFGIVNALNISSITVGNPSVFIVTPSGAQVLNPAESLMVNVLFVPIAQVSYKDTMIIVHDAPGSPAMIPLTGWGYTFTPGVGAQFQVPIHFEGVDPRYDTSTVWIGISGDGPGGSILDNTYGPDLDPAYGPVGMWQEQLAPPPPPSFFIWTTVIDIPGRSAIGPLGMFDYDFRGFGGPAQIDTFAIQIKGNDVGNGPMTISWPSNLTDYSSGPWTLKKKQGPNWITLIDMLTETSYTDPNTAYATQLDYLIIKECVNILTGISQSTKELLLPVDYTLGQNYPNPFNPETNILVSVPQRSDVCVTIYNLLGQEINTIFTGKMERGIHTLRWNGKDRNGIAVASGTYFYRMQAGSFVETRKMMLMK